MSPKLSLMSCNTTVSVLLYQHVCGVGKELHYAYFHLHLSVLQERCYFGQKQLIQKFISRWSFCMADSPEAINDIVTEAADLSIFLRYNTTTVSYESFIIFRQ